MGNSITSLFSKPRKNHDVEFIEEVVLSEILPKLPVKTLMRFKCVSKKWLDRISSDPLLFEAHIRYHLSSPAAAKTSAIIVANHFSRKKRPKLLMLHGNDDRSPKVKKVEMSYLFGKEALAWNLMDIIGSSNGLVLLTNGPSLRLPNKEFVLWNPATREFRFLPNQIELRTGIDFDQIHGYPIFDLGFDEKNKDHKVVRVDETSLSLSTCLNLQVFSGNNDSWRKLRPLKGYKLLSQDARVSLKGVLYLLAFRDITCGTSNNSNNDDNNDNLLVILSFDYRGNESLREFAAGPKCYDDHSEVAGEQSARKLIRLAKWKENSIALVAEHTELSGFFDFWVMVNGVSWHRLFTFNFYHRMRGIWRDRFCIILTTHRRCVELGRWDPDHEDIRKKGGPKKLAKLGRSWCFCEKAYDYVPSLYAVYPRHLKVNGIE